LDGVFPAARLAASAAQLCLLMKAETTKSFRPVREVTMVHRSAKDDRAHYKHKQQSRTSVDDGLLLHAGEVQLQAALPELAEVDTAEAQPCKAGEGYESGPTTRLQKASASVTSLAQQQAGQLALEEHRGVVAVGQDHEALALVGPLEAEHVQPAQPVVRSLQTSPHRVRNEL
jgi:hypothetical protein